MRCRKFVFFLFLNFSLIQITFAHNQSPDIYEVFEKDRKEVADAFKSYALKIINAFATKTDQERQIKRLLLSLAKPGAPTQMMRDDLKKMVTTEQVMQPITFGKSQLQIGHLLVFLQRDTYIKKLRIQQLNAKTVEGWTPAHFAALIDGESTFQGIFEYLNTHTQVAVRDNLLGITAQELKERTHLRPLMEQEINFWDDALQEVVTYGGEIYKNKTGFTFVEQTKISPLKAFSVWKKGEVLVKHPIFFSPEVSISLRHLIKKSYQKYESSSDHVYIKYAGENMGNALHARKSFQPGEVVLPEYEGLWVGFDGKKLSLDHSTEYIDGTHIQGYAATTIDCLPNMKVFSYTLNSLPGDHASIAIRPIKEHELLCWDYISHDVKKNLEGKIYKEMKAEELDSILSTYDMDAERIWRFFSSYRSSSSSSKELLRYMDEISVYDYMRTSVSVLLRLVLEGKINGDKFLNLLKKNILAPHLAIATQEEFEIFFRELKILKKYAYLDWATIGNFIKERLREGETTVLMYNFLIHLGDKSLYREGRMLSPITELLKKYRNGFCLHLRFAERNPTIEAILKSSRCETLREEL